MKLKNLLKRELLAVNKRYFDEILAGSQVEGTCFWIHGPLFCGKSVLLAHLCRAMRVKYGEDQVAYFNWADPCGATEKERKLAEFKEAIEAATSGNLRVLIIDSIEDVFDTPLAASLKEAMIREKRVLFFAGSHLGQFDASYTWPGWAKYLSPLILASVLNVKELNPWNKDWKRFIREEIETCLNLNDDKSVRIWIQAILKVTGGHPALLGPVSMAMRDLAKRTAKGEHLHDIEKRLLARPDELEREEVEAFVEDAALQADYFILEAIRQFQTENHPLFDAYLELAKGKGEEALREAVEFESDETTLVQDGLKEDDKTYIVNTGLAYRDVGDSKRPLRVQGSILLRCLLKAAEAGEPSIEAARVEDSIHLQEATKGEFRRAVLVIPHDGKTLDVPLSGQTLLVMETLLKAQKDGNKVPLASLKKLLEVEYDSGVTSAVGHLRRKLRKKGVDKLVRSADGEFFLDEKPKFL